MAPTPSSLDKRLTVIESQQTEILDIGRRLLRNGSDDHWFTRLLRRNEVNLVAIATATVWIIRDNTEIRFEVTKTIPLLIHAVDEKAMKAIDAEREARITDVSTLREFCCTRNETGLSPVYDQTFVLASTSQ